MDASRWLNKAGVDGKPSSAVQLAMPGTRSKTGPLLRDGKSGTGLQAPQALACGVRSRGKRLLAPMSARLPDAKRPGA